MIVDYFHVSVFPVEFSSVQINSNLLVVPAHITSAKCSIVARHRVEYIRYGTVLSFLRDHFWPFVQFFAH